MYLICLQRNLKCLIDFFAFSLLLGKQPPIEFGEVWLILNQQLIQSNNILYREEVQFTTVEI